MFDVIWNSQLINLKKMFDFYYKDVKLYYKLIHSRLVFNKIRLWSLMIHSLEPSFYDVKDVVNLENRSIHMKNVHFKNFRNS